MSEENHEVYNCPKCGGGMRRNLAFGPSGLAYDCQNPECDVRPVYFSEAPTPWTSVENLEALTEKLAEDLPLMRLMVTALYGEGEKR